MMLLNRQQLMSATGCSAARAELFLPYLQGTMKAFDITTPHRIAGFLSQIGHESTRLERLEENLKYSVAGLLETFGRHRISAADAQRLGRSAAHPAHQEGIANTVYGGEWGRVNLGNFVNGDGWRFRGRGLKQLTGRRNYDRCGAAIGEDLLSYPDRLLLPVNAALSAGWFWASHGLNAMADRGDVPGMTRVINGGANGLAERTALYAAALQAFA
jgi:putative chitinase